LDFDALGFDADVFDFLTIFDLCGGGGGKSGSIASLGPLGSGPLDSSPLGSGPLGSSNCTFFDFFDLLDPFYLFDLLLG